MDNMEMDELGQLDKYVFDSVKPASEALEINMKFSEIYVSLYLLHCRHISGPSLTDVQSHT